MNILIATDGSKYSRKAVEESIRLFAGQADRQIKILSVYETIFPISGEAFAMSADYYRQFETEAKSEAEKFVAEAAEMIRGKFPDINLTTEVRPGSSGREIVETAQEWPADLIIVGSHGRGFWGRMLIGSTSDAVMHHADCSVLIVRPEKTVEEVETV